MINKSIKINHLLISILISTSIVLLYIQFLGNDNTNTIYGDIFHDGSYWEGQFRNYRYVSSSIAFLLYKAGIGYYELIYLWALFFLAP